MSDVTTMLELAKKVRLHAYAPYSHFLVGATILAEDGQYYVGCNVENTSFRMTDCAEGVAVGTMVANGVRKINAVLVVTDTAVGVPPCGACLQKMSEFADEETMLYIANIEGVKQSQKFQELFPAGFSKEFTEIKKA